MSFLKGFREKVLKENKGFVENFGYVLFFSSIISVISSVVVLNFCLSHQNQKIKEVDDTCQNLESKFKGLFESVKELDNNINLFKDEIKDTKENFVHIYTDIASIQKDIGVIKEEFHINSSDSVNDAMKKLDSEKYNFLLSFENLVNEGMPFEDFLASYDEKVDMKKYPATNELLKFQDIHIKSIPELKKDISAFGASAFDLKAEESFFEKQKRIIKEKIMDAIKIKKLDDENGAEKVLKQDGVQKDYKGIYEKAVNAFSDGDLESAITLLESVKVDNFDLSPLITDIRKRIELDKAFGLFKEEFLDIETKR